ncbi:MAG: hypothetical protein ACR2MS_03405, partial [Weeksellaceae bacterium]
GLFDLRLNCNVDQGQSSMIVENSKFLNIKRGTAQYQAAAIFRITNFPILTLRNNTFLGNRGGYGGVLDFRNSGEFISVGNLWQDNYSGHSGGAIYVSGNYPCSGIASVKNSVTITNDEFLANHAGLGGAAGRGGAIHIASNVIGTGAVAKEVNIINSKFKENFTTAFSGGAIMVNSSEPFSITGSVFCNNDANRWFPGNSAGNGGAVAAYGSSSFSVNNSTFFENGSEQNGGAIYSNRSSTLIDGCSYFENNNANDLGGALWSDNETTINSAYFANNATADGSGGAIFFNSPQNHTISSVTFLNNTSADDGGAIFANNAAINSNGLLDISNSYFVNNKSENSGGAIGVYYYSISTDNIIFDNNIAGDDGGALYVNTLAGHTFDLRNSKYDSNVAGNFGGAINFFTGTNTDANIINNIFLNNTATNRGGAISVLDRGVSGNEIDIIDSNKFFGNNINGDASNNSANGRSDIYLENGAGLYRSNIGSLKNNSLQFAPNTTNYPNGSFGTGFRLGTGNTQQLSAVTVDYNAFVCNPLECPIVEPTTPAPLVLSADRQNTGTPSDYTTYTDVAINNSCVATPSEVAFTARSNKAARQDGTVLDLPAKHIIITYSLIKTNNLDGTIERTDGLVIDANSADRIEETSDEIPTSDPRDVYQTYFLNLSGKISAGYTYTYTITQVEIPNEGTFNYEAGQYKTVLVTDFCDSDGDGIPNYMETKDDVDPLADDNNDGIPNYLDSTYPGLVDVNGDGVNDNFDTDGDGQADFLDIDSDNDGILDSVEAGPNPESPIDTDGDGVPDYLDLDSDNDGINDVDEGNPDAVDADGDGMVDGPYGDNGLANSLENGDDSFNATITPPTDTNGDGIPDYQQTDSDGDGIPDSIDTEPYGSGSTPPQSQDPSVDANGDGIVDGTTDTDGDGIMDIVDKNPRVFGESKPNCEIIPNSNSDSIKTTQVGISTLDRNNQEWLSSANNKLGAYIVLESTTKGFIIPRFAATADIENTIGSDVNAGVEEGMIVWDNEANCLKMFYDNTNDGKMTWNCISSDTCTNTKP